MKKEFIRLFFFRAIFIMTRELEFALTIENENRKGKREF